MKGKVKASFTVEAAMIMPIIFFVIFAIIYLAFCLHDRVKIQTLADKALHKASMIIKHEADIKTGRIEYENINTRGIFYLITGSTKSDEEQIKDYLEEELKAGLFCTEIIRINVNVDTFKITVLVEGKYEIPIKGVTKYFNPNNHIVIKISSPIHDPGEILRISDVVIETGEKIKGINRLKDLLDRFVGPR